MLLLDKIKSLKSRLRLTEGTKRRFFTYSKAYEISGTKNLNWNPIYISGKNYPTFQNELENFKRNLITEINSKKGVSYLKFGDGDYFFLKGEPVGSATPGRRAISRALSKVELATYRENSRRADRYLCEIDLQNRKYFSELFGAVNPIPAEFVYGLTANHWLTELPYKIGIIGADRKLDIIQKLMSFEEYKNYLGLNEFSDYITIPQKFACDDLGQRIEELEIQIKNSSAEVFLLGVGHLKSGILSELPRLKKAVYLDIGSGIDALAGLIDSKRPYFGAWTNYRLRSQDLYSEIDLLQYNSSKTSYLD